MIDYHPSMKTCADCDTCLKVEWSELDRGGLEQLANSLKTFYYQPGEAIFHQSDAPEGIYCIGQGKILLCQYDSFGNEIGFGMAYQGETLGWRSFFARENHTATALALTPCRICLVPKSTVHRLIRGYPALARRFLRTVAKDRGPTESLLLRNPRLPARIRLINLLLILCKNIYVPNSSEELRFSLPMNRRQLASLIGVRTETLSRTIATLHKEGLVRFHNREVTIKNHDHLVYESNRSKR